MGGQDLGLAYLCRSVGSGRGPGVYLKSSQSCFFSMTFWFWVFYYMVEHGTVGLGWAGLASWMGFEQTPGGWVGKHTILCRALLCYLCSTLNL